MPLERELDDAPESSPDSRPDPSDGDAHAETYREAIRDVRRAFDMLPLGVTAAEYRRLALVKLDELERAVDQ